MVRQKLFDLNPDELHYYSFIARKDRFNRSFNAVQVPFGRIFVSKKWKRLSLKYLLWLKKQLNPGHSQIKFHVSTDMNLMAENVTQDKNETMITISVSGKASKTSGMWRRLCLES